MSSKQFRFSRRWSAAAVTVAVGALGLSACSGDTQTETSADDQTRACC